MLIPKYCATAGRKGLTQDNPAEKRRTALQETPSRTRRHFAKNVQRQSNSTVSFRELVRHFHNFMEIALTNRHDGGKQQAAAHSGQTGENQVE